MADILFLAHRLPFPPDRGDKIRSYNILKRLARTNRVHLIAFADDPRDLTRKAGLQPLTASRTVIFRAKPQWIAAVEAIARRKPMSLTAFHNAAMKQAVAAVLARHPIDTIFVFSSQMAQYLPPPGRHRVIVDFCDMDAAKFEAYAQSARQPMRWMLRREANLLLQHDRALAARASASLFVSEAEAALFRARARADRVHVVENGIDTDFFDPHASFRRLEPCGEPLIVFTGQMDYRPNIEAVSWFAEAILPHIRVRFADARFAIVGRNPTEAVRALTRLPGVVVTGEVADVRGWLAAATLVVAPLKLARGVQNKVLEAMAMARPVVASVPAAEGIDHGGTIRVGASVGEIADHVCALAGNRAAAEAMGEAARARVIERYGWSARLGALDAFFGTFDRRSAREFTPV